MEDKRFMTLGGRILCVENNEVLLASRCKVLERAGYDTIKATPQVAEALLYCQKYDLVVISKATEFEMTCIVNVSDGAEILVLSEFTYPAELLSQVAERLQHVQMRRP